MHDPYQRLNQLLALRAQSDKDEAAVAENSRRLDAMIAAERERVSALDAEERRRRIRSLPGGLILVGIAGAAGAVHKAAQHAGTTTTVAVGGAATVALGATIALAIGLGGDDQPPPIAGQQPSISIPTPGPSMPPPVRPGHRPRPRHPQPEPPRVVALPVRTGPVHTEPVKLGVPPKAPEPSPEQPALPPEGQPADVKLSPPTCAAEVRLLSIAEVRLLCRP